MLCVKYNLEGRWRREAFWYREQSHLGGASLDPVDCNVASMVLGPGKRQHHLTEATVHRWQYLASQTVEASAGNSTKRS